MMKFPSKLKHFNMFLDSENYAGVISEIELPKFARKMEEYRGGGMHMPVDIDMGGEKMEMTITMGGYVCELFREYAACNHNKLILRFTGALETDDSCEVTPMEIEVNGRFKEIELGTAKSGEESNMKGVLTLSYTKITLNGVEICVVDAVNMIDKWYGKDRLEDARRAIGV